LKQKEENNSIKKFSLNSSSLGSHQGQLQKCGLKSLDFDHDIFFLLRNGKILFRRMQDLHLLSSSMKEGN